MPRWAVSGRLGLLRVWRDVVNPFGRIQIRRASAQAIAKFRACPWHFFDGVADTEPNRLVWGDFAITRVMSSGLRSDLINGALARATAAGADALLAAIPDDHDLICAETENEEVYAYVDRLFQALDGYRFRRSRTAKVLCRKRPRCIPMLDDVVADFLLGVCHHWLQNPRQAPNWFAASWRSWSSRTVVTPYLRMIREDARVHLSELEQIRAELAADRSTGVPGDAPLLRVWEAIVFWTLYPHM